MYLYLSVLWSDESFSQFSSDAKAKCIKLNQETLDMFLFQPDLCVFNPPNWFYDDAINEIVLLPEHQKPHGIVTQTFLLDEFRSILDRALMVI